MPGPNANIFQRATAIEFTTIGATKANVWCLTKTALELRSTPFLTYCFRILPHVYCGCKQMIFHTRSGFLVKLCRLMLIWGRFHVVITKVTLRSTLHSLNWDELVWNMILEPQDVWQHLRVSPISKKLLWISAGPATEARHGHRDHHCAFLTVSLATDFLLCFWKLW